MSIDKQRVAAVAALEALGFAYTSDRGWLPPINSGRGTFGAILPDFTSEADAMHALPVIRADALMGEPEAFSDATTEIQLFPTRSKHMQSSAGREVRCRAVKVEEVESDPARRGGSRVTRIQADGSADPSTRNPSRTRTQRLFKGQPTRPGTSPTRRRCPATTDAAVTPLRPHRADRRFLRNPVPAG